MLYVIIGAVILLNLFIFVLRARAKLGGLRAGDFFKVEIPRKVTEPLAMGTRLDCAAALKKAGTPADELKRLLDGNHDQELVDRYWLLREPSTTGTGS